MSSQELLDLSIERRSSSEICTAYDTLRNHNVELLCRHAKSCLLYSKQTTDEAKRDALLQQGSEAIGKALNGDSNSFDLLKCAALISNEIASHAKVRRREEFEEFKQFADRALDVKPDDFELLYLRGRYHFINPSFSWLWYLGTCCQSCSFDFAIEDLLEAEHLRPKEYIEIHYYLALCYLAKNNVESAMKHLRDADSLEAVDVIHQRMKAEVRGLIMRFSS